jgi:hypothetical protein
MDFATAVLDTISQMDNAICAKQPVQLVIILIVVLHVKHHISSEASFAVKKDAVFVTLLDA